MKAEECSAMGTCSSALGASGVKRDSKDLIMFNMAGAVWQF